MITRVKTYVFCLLFAVIFGLMFNSCSKEHLTNSQIPFLGGDSAKGEARIDKWVYDTLTQPYNVRVIYKFDEFEATSSNVDLVPVKESIVIPALSDIKKVWIDTYEAEGGTTFMKTYIIKVINMIGSPAYNVNGSITLGEAEGGAKINLYDMNTYDINHINRANIVQKMHTIHHEFGHILQQNKYYSPDFQKISVGFYTGNWTLETMDTALSHGFVTPYASSAPDEDFVETIATMLVEGRDYFEGLKSEAIIKGYKNAADRLTQKEQIIVAYYKDKWNMDFYDLQKKVKAALDEIVPPPPPTPLSSLLGAGLQYGTLSLGSADRSSNLHGSFGTAFNTCITNVENTGDLWDSLYFTFTHTDTLLLRFRFHSGGSYYLADYRFKFSKNNAAGEMTFGPPVVFLDRDGFNGSNAQYYGAYLKPFIDFITNNKLVAVWPGGKRDFTQSPPLGALASASDTSSNITGKLE